MKYRSKEYQVIYVDWSKGTSSSYYLPAVSNARITAKIISDVIKNMIDVNQLNPMNIHIIGYSVGAHVAGMAGKNLLNRYRIGWITGLEPASAMFDRFTTSGHIYKSDAWFVDIIHTSSGSILEGFSTMDSLGCIDYYPNGALAQIGCQDMPLGAVGALVSNDRPCSHDRAPILYMNDYPEDSCQMVSYNCLSYDDFLDGKCADCGPGNSDCQLFGLSYYLQGKKNFHPVKKTCHDHQKFYIKTTDYPFCREYSLMFYGDVT